MTICACGCGEEIIPAPHHKYQPPRYQPGHFQKTGQSQRGRQTSSKRIPPGTVCACGCGAPIADRHKSGKPRYQQSQSGSFYLPGHQPHMTGSANPAWKGGRSIRDGYVLLRIPGHHLATRKGIVLEHRLVWEEANGRRLRPDEDVHHVNGNRADNRPENLVALTKSEHAREHERNPQQFLSREQRQEGGRKGAAARWHPDSH